MYKKKHTQPFTLDNLVYQLNSSSINLNPSYQRESVWTLDQKQLLIDSLIHDYDIPKLYFRELDNSDYIYEAVDGQQRLRTIQSFIHGDFTFADDASPVEIRDIEYPIASKKHNELDPKVRQKLQSTTLDIVILSSSYNDDDIEDIFLRLQNGTPLNSPEKRRAIAGNFRNVVAELSKDSFFKYAEFKDKRYSFEDICAKLLHLSIKGEYTTVSHAALKKTYENNPEFNTDALEFKKLKNSFKFIVDSFKEGVDIRLKKHSALTFPLLVSKMMDDYNLRDFKSEFAEAIRKFELQRIQADLEVKNGREADAKMLIYKNAARSDDPSSLLARETHVREFILSEIPQISLKDKKRSFSDDQRNIIFLRDKGICVNCNKVCTRDDFHADHIKPHSIGGFTSVENGQVLCIACNLRKGSSFDLN